MNTSKQPPEQISGPQVLRLWTVILLATIGLALPGIANAVVSEWIELRSANGHLEIDTKVAGIAGYSILDTGSNMNAINEEFLKTNNLKFGTVGSLKMTGVYGTEERPMYKAIPVEIMGANINFTKLVSLDMGSDNFQLLLGESFLELYVFQFDYPNNRMRFMTRDSVNLKKSKNLKARRDRKTGLPIVKVDVSGTVAAGQKKGKQTSKELWLMLDTGYTGGALIKRSTASGASWLAGRKTKVRNGRGINRSGQLESFNLDSLEIAGFKLENPMLEVPLDNQEIELFKKEKSTGSNLKRSRNKWSGILGHDVLKHFVVTIDYKTAEINLQPGGQ